MGIRHGGNLKGGNMTDKERNKIIANALGIDFWITAQIDDGYLVDGFAPTSTDYGPKFNTPEGFFKIMEIGITRDWWKEFISPWTIYREYIPLSLVHPSHAFVELSTWLETREAKAT